jgi:hypothetical protein
LITIENTTKKEEGKHELKGGNVDRRTVLPSRAVLPLGYELVYVLERRNDERRMKEKRLTCLLACFFLLSLSLSLYISHPKRRFVPSRSLPRRNDRIVRFPIGFDFERTIKLSTMPSVVIGVEPSWDCNNIKS